MKKYINLFFWTAVIAALTLATFATRNMFLILPLALCSHPFDKAIDQFKTDKAE